MQNLKSKVLPFTNSDDAAVSLGFVRIVFYFIIWFHTHPWPLLQALSFPSELWLPQGLLVFFETPFSISTSAIQIIDWVWQLSALLCIFGFGFKYFSVVFLILTFFVHNVGHSFGYQTHSIMPLIVGLMILTFSPAAERLSIDSYLKKKKSSSLEDVNLAVLTVRIVFCFIFFAAGLSKLVNGGLDWFLSDNLQNVFIQTQVYFPDTKKWVTSLGVPLYLAQHPLLCQILAAGTILLELITPLALLKGRVRNGIIFFIFLAQVGFYFALMANFRSYLALYLFWFNWRSIFLSLQSWMASLLKKRVL